MNQIQQFWWNGKAMVPLNPRLADRAYAIGEIYRLSPCEDRSISSHNHEFGWLHEAWLNLPERLAEQYPSAEHLRKRALIETGYYDEEIIDAGSKAAALRVAAYIRKSNDFAAIIVRGPLVAVRTAKSQSRRAMNKHEFQASKTAIMTVIAELLGTTPDVLARAA